MCFSKAQGANPGPFSRLQTYRAGEVQASFTLPPQSECPQRQTISILFPIPSQWGLQYFAFPAGTHVQARFPHFLGFVIFLLSPLSFLDPFWCDARRQHSTIKGHTEAKGKR
jgi:hypothetical protein